jgi:hypothetical protein
VLREISQIQKDKYHPILSDGETRPNISWDYFGERQLGWRKGEELLEVNNIEVHCIFL